MEVVESKQNIPCRVSLVHTCEVIEYGWPLKCNMA